MACSPFFDFALFVSSVTYLVFPPSLPPSLPPSRHFVFTLVQKKLDTCNVRRKLLFTHFFKEHLIFCTMCSTKFHVHLPCYLISVQQMQTADQQTS